jgi:hypothetical protein
VTAEETPADDATKKPATKPAPSKKPALNNENQLDLPADGPSEENPSWSSLEIPRARVKMLDFAAQQEQAPDDQNVGFSARLFAQVSLPQRNPKDLPYYERRNGNVTLTISPALVTQKDGSRLRKYPFGIYPRLALTYVATEAFMSKSPVIDLGSSMRQFLSKLDVEYSGRNANIVKDQLAALFGAQLSVEGLAVDETGHGTRSEFFQIAKSVSLWWANKEDSGQEGLWSSEVRLSQEFYDSIINAPIPVDLAAIRALGGSSLRIDMYLWATYRMFYLRKPTKIRWDDLSNQFGAQYGRVRAFKAAFAKELPHVKIVYPALNAEATPEYLILRPSLTHVRSNKPYRQVDSSGVGGTGEAN